MSENLSNFLVDLACDPDRQGRFTANPQAEFTSTGLTPQEQAAILSRDPRQVGNALGALAKSAGMGIHKKKKGGKKKSSKKSGSKKTKS